MRQQSPRRLEQPISDWRAGLCKANPITVEIPFAVAGKFVYHCHILEHEDGGIMAVIQVVPAKNQLAFSILDDIRS